MIGLPVERRLQSGSRVQELLRLGRVQEQCREEEA